MIKPYCIPLAIVAALSAFQSLQAHETKLPIKDTQVVSTNALFKPIPSKLTKMQVTKDQTLDSYYKYNANINASAVEEFKQFIPQLFNANKALIKTASPLSSVVRFDPLVAPSLGMDLNFDVGNILSKDTKISSIWKWKASNYIDGKIDDTVSLTDTYSVRFTTATGMNASIEIKDDISGNLWLNNYNVSFSKKIDGTSYEIQVMNRSKAKPRVRDPRHNDVNNSDDIPVDKKKPKYPLPL